MRKVKGSKEYQWKVVKYRPRLKLWFGVGLAALAAVAVQGAYLVGQGAAAQKSDAYNRELVAVQAELIRAQDAEHSLRRQLEGAKLGSDVDRQALEEVRQQLVKLKLELAALDEENRFYRNLMAPAGTKSGLNFGTLELATTEQPRTFRYKLVMQQLATQHELLNGTLTFNIVGRRKDQAEVLSLHDVSAEVDSPNVKLRFKYFQNIEGLLVLPAGFEPESIELTARSTGKNAAVIEKRFGWLVQQNVAVSDGQ